MSVRWRIMASMVFVIVLTVAVSVSVGYYATRSRLGTFVERIGGDEAQQLARNLGREYAAAGGWATVDQALTRAGYTYDGAPRGERSETDAGEHAEGFHHDRVRVVVSGVDGGRVVRDNLSQLSPGTAVPSLGRAPGDRIRRHNKPARGRGLSRREP